MQVHQCMSLLTQEARQQLQDKWCQQYTANQVQEGG